MIISSLYLCTLYAPLSNIRLCHFQCPLILNKARSMHLNLRINAAMYIKYYIYKKSNNNVPISIPRILVDHLHAADAASVFHRINDKGTGGALVRSISKVHKCFFTFSDSKRSSVGVLKVHSQNRTKRV
jgi:hypothetical protein